MINEYLVNNIKIHHAITGQDVYKFIYQATFGAEHSLNDVDKMAELFHNEYANVIPHDGVLIEELSDVFVRINMAVWKAKQKDEKELFALFVETAKLKVGTDALFNKNLNDAIDTIKQMNLSNKDNLINELNELMNSPINAVHHSDLYKQQEVPHYRVIRKDFL